MKQKLLFIVNPLAGGGKRSSGIEHNIGLQLNCTRYDAEVRYTRYPGHATELAKASDAVCVVAVGGDGTVNEVASGLVGTGKVLGIIPCGSGNGFANHLGISRNLNEAIRVINEGASFASDYATINGTPFLCSCGVGLDADVSYAFSSSKKRGHITYVFKTITRVLCCKEQQYSLAYNGIEVKVSAIMITVGNANQWGNNYYICPDASLQDGILDVTILHKFPVCLAPVLVGKLLRRKSPQASMLSLLNAVTLL